MLVGGRLALRFAVAASALVAQVHAAVPREGEAAVAGLAEGGAPRCPLHLHRAAEDGDQPGRAVRGGRHAPLPAWGTPHSSNPSEVFWGG